MCTKLSQRLRQQQRAMGIPDLGISSGHPTLGYFYPFPSLSNHAFSNHECAVMHPWASLPPPMQYLDSRSRFFFSRLLPRGWVGAVKVRNRRSSGKRYRVEGKHSWVRSWYPCARIPRRVDLEVVRGTFPPEMTGRQEGSARPDGTGSSRLIAWIPGDIDVVIDVAGFVHPVPVVCSAPAWRVSSIWR